MTRTGPVSGTFNADGRLTCGCVIDGLSIAWCPTHAAAPAMRAMLEIFAGFAKDARHYDLTGRCADASALLATLATGDTR